ncbi:MAG TPA: hypothetical protein PLN72_01300 [bacterium]|nr:hypothetical protein [bacterium]
MIRRARSIALMLTLLMVCSLHAQSRGGRWQMEGNGEDTAPWDALPNVGVPQGGAFFSALLSAPEGNSFLWLDTLIDHDYMKIEDSFDLDFENENVGISMWIYPTVLNDVHFLVNKGTQSDAAKSTCYALRISLAKKIEFLIRDSGNKAQTAASGFTVPLNQWTFVAAFYDYAAGKVYFWNRVTAAPVDSALFRFDYLANDGPLSIGSWYRSDPSSPSIKDFQGGIDDVRISGRRQDLIPLGTAVKRRDSAALQPQSLHIYPNPVSLSRQPWITINTAAVPAGPATLTLFNLRGQAVISREIEGSPWRLPLQDGRGGALPAGTYLLQIKSGRSLLCRSLTLVR